MENKDFKIVDGILLEYTGQSKDVVIPDGVKRIITWVFAGKNINTVVVPNSVNKIEDHAFLYNPLKHFIISTTVKEIGDEIFSKLETLTIINKGNLIEFLSKLEKSGNLKVALSIEIKGKPLTEEEKEYIRTNLRTYNITYEIKEKDSNISKNKDFKIVNGILLKYTGKSKDVVIPNGVNVITAWSLSSEVSDENINTLVIPDSVTNINSFALLGNKLSLLTIPSTVEYVGEVIYDYLETLCIVNKGNIIKFLNKLKSSRNLNAALSIEITGKPLTQIEQSYISLNLSGYNIRYNTEETTILNNSEPLIAEVLTDYIKMLEDHYQIGFLYTKEQRKIIINYLLDASVITNLEQGKKLLESVFMEASINLQSNITTNDILMMILKIKAEESKKAQTSR